MMNKLKFLFLTLLLGGQLLTAQNKTSFGVELKGIPWKEDNFTDWNAGRFSFSFYVGAWAETQFAKNFTTVFSLGLHNVIYESYKSEFLYTDFVYTDISEALETKFMNSLELKVEPRYYFFNQEKHKIYGAIPFSIETSQIDMWDVDFQLIYRILPSVGYKFDFSKHFALGAEAGLGWMKRDCFKSSKFDYNLSVGLQYKF